MYSPFYTDTHAFQTAQTRRMDDICAEVEQIRLAQSLQPPKSTPRFRLILTSLAMLFFS
jgi:hypothetical protein